MIVLDASAAILGLGNDGDARQLMAVSSMAVPHLIDIEIAHALRSRALRGDIEVASATVALDRWSRLGVVRVPATGLLGRVWDLRDNLSAYDAAYVALAEAMGCSLVTADARLARAPGPTCPITVIRR